jgi:hypothetical protein
MRQILLLLAILLVLFSTSDAWKIYGSEAYVRFGLGVIAVFRIHSD